MDTTREAAGRTNGPHVIYLDICDGCKGEGRRNQPPYDWRKPAIPIRFRHPSPCGTCNGYGYVPCLVIPPDLSYSLRL